ncbi:MAG: hypothetical protein ABWY57_16015 [Mycetocola sp.]
MPTFTPKASEVPLIQFNIVGVGEFQLPVLGQPGVPFGVTSAFGVFESSRKGGSEQQKLGAWSLLIQTLSDSYPAAVRVLSRLDGDDVAEVFASWGKESADFDPKASSSPDSSSGTGQLSGSTSSN